MAGLTPDGLEILRLPEVISNIETSELTNIDPNLSTAPDTLLGQLNNIFGSSLSDLWALLEAINDNYNITKAEGKNLDDLAILRNVSRISASKSNTNRQQFIGSNGTTIPISSLFANPITGDQFTNTAPISIDSSSCLSADLSVVQVLNNTDYEITVSGTTYMYTSDADATANEIVTAFQSAINGDTNATWTASLNGDILTITSDSTDAISISVITYIGITSVTVEGYIESVVEGAIIAPSNSITQIITVIPGLTSTTNITQLIIGREEETDEELRIRIATSGNADCTGTIPAIEAAILNNVSGVTSVVVTENTTAVTDIDGRPPHSYETVVVGGNNTDVAQEIWRTKPAGIQLHGNTNVIIVDSNGNNRSIDFTRATVVNIAVQVSYTLYNEESFPVGGDSLIQQAVVDHINSLGVGVDVITGRMFGPIYTSVAGIDTLLVEIQVIASPGDPPNGGSWQTATIAIGPDELASTTTIDVYPVAV